MERTTNSSQATPPSNSAESQLRLPAKGRLRLVAHRPGPGFSDAERSAKTFPVLLPDETARLFREALAYAQYAFHPRLKEAPAQLLPRLMASAASGGFRDAGFNPQQQEEWDFQADALCLRQAGDPWNLEDHWKDRMAVPRLHLLQDLGALEPYEYGLVYLLMHTMDRNLSRSLMLGEIRALIRSWNGTMDPGQGQFSLTVLRLVLRAYAWWTRLKEGRESAHQGMAWTVVGALEGACAAVSGQHLMARRNMDWNRIHLAMLAGAMAHALPVLPKLQAWHAHWRDRPEASASAMPGEMVHAAVPNRTKRKGRSTKLRTMAPAPYPDAGRLRAVAEPKLSLTSGKHRAPLDAQSPDHGHQP